MVTGQCEPVEGGMEVDGVSVTSLKCRQIPSLSDEVGEGKRAGRDGNDGNDGKKIKIWYLKYLFSTTIVDIRFGPLKRTYRHTVIPSSGGGLDGC